VAAWAALLAPLASLFAAILQFLAVFL